jgi:hypothetical protein
MENAPFTCALCADRDVCQAPCAWLERRLPKLPPAYREKPSGLWPEKTLVLEVIPPSRSTVSRVRRRLTRRQRTAVDLVLVRGLSERAAARRIRISRNALRKRLARAFRRL